MKQRFPWREGNRIELLEEGERFFPAMLAAIRQARHSLLLEFYVVASGTVLERFIGELQAALERGVRVRMIVDGFGALRFSPSDRERLIRAGVELVVYNPIRARNWTRNFARDHRKLLVVDQEVAFIGGTGLSDEYWLHGAKGAPWHELMCRVEGAVVADLVAVFDALWQRCTAEPLSPPVPPPAVGDARIRVTTVQGVANQGIKTSFLQRVRQADDKVWLMTAYFVPSFLVRAALRRAAKRGVDVRLIIAGPQTDLPWVYHASKRYYRALLKAGVKIYEYQPRCLHGKAAIVDDWSTVGSCNLDHWNLRWNLEANIEVVEPRFLQQVTELIERDIVHSQAITYAQWRRRPWHRKVREYLWAWLAKLILKIR